MAQQRGMKRAEKVLKRKRRVEKDQREKNLMLVPGHDHAGHDHAGHDHEEHKKEEKKAKPKKEKAAAETKEKPAKKKKEA